MPSPASRLAGSVFPLLVLVGSLLLALGLSEAALWVFAPVPYDEWMVYENEGHIHYRGTPNQVVRNRFGAQIRINKDGFRGPDYSFEKPAGTLRLAVLGESSAFCYNSSEEKSWPGALRNALERQLGVRVEVINLALPGFDIFHSKVNYMAYGRAFRPDAIVVYHTWNDMKRFRDLETVPYRPRGPVANKPLWQRVARATQIGRRARSVAFAVTGRRLENQYKADEGQGARADRPVDGKAFAWERQNFRDLVMLAKADGVLPILVSQATLVTRDPPATPAVAAALAATPAGVGMTLPLIADTWQRVAGLIEEVARESGAVFVDGLGAVPPDVRYLEDHVHLWDEGSAVLADRIARTLVGDERFLEVAGRAGRSVVARRGQQAGAPPAAR
jgi:hypothetical protein